MSREDMFVRGLMLMCEGALFTLLGACVIGIYGHYAAKRAQRAKRLG